MSIAQNFGSSRAAAVEAGADIYVQKPISVDVVEGQAMLAAARKHRRVVQVGTQRRSTPHLIEARELIQFYRDMIASDAEKPKAQ